MMKNVHFILRSAGDGYTLDVAENGQEALEKLRTDSYDLVMLDLWMEPVDGLQVLNVLKECDPDAVAIILTGHSTLESALDALRLGAFDYLLKPAAPETILLRVREGLERRRQLQRRQRLTEQIGTLRQTLQDLENETVQLNRPVTRSRPLHSGNLVVDKHHRVAALNRKPLDLTTTEFDLLVCLVEASPNPVAPRQLLQQALSYDSSESEASEIVKAHIHHLRRKIEPDPAQPRHIKNVRYKGYLWCPDEG
jgi:DNA-binding response OmpR family regulator